MAMVVCDYIPAPLQVAAAKVEPVRSPEWLVGWGGGYKDSNTASAIKPTGEEEEWQGLKRLSVKVNGVDGLGLD